MMLLLIGAVVALGITTPVVLATALAYSFLWFTRKETP